MNQHDKLQLDVTCLAAMVGPEKMLLRLLDLFDCQEMRDAFPWFRLVGAVAPRPSTAVSARLKRAHVEVFDSVDELATALPDLGLFFDLQDDPEALSVTRNTMPVSVSVMDTRSTMTFWEMLMSGQLCAPCQTSLFQAKAFLSTVLDGLEDDILLLDKQGRVVDVNRSLSRRLGMHKADLLGRHCRDIEGGNFCQRSHRECPFQETLVTKRKAEAMHTKLDAEGRLLYFRVYTYPLFNEAGKLTHVVEMRRDITNRTYTEQRLQQAQKMAAIGELSTYIAHEIRNPLFAIGGFARALLRNDTLDADAQEKVNIILEESRRLDKILRSILNYARPTDALAEEVDINKVVGETVQLMGIGCEQEGIVIMTDLDPDVAQAKGVPELLKQCLINMLKNAMEAMNGTGGTIVVRTGMSDTYVFVQVEDDGVGMPDDVKIRVFNPFFSTKDQGSGLGLAMTKKIVEEVGGRIVLESQHGAGTAVTLLLPSVLAVDSNAKDIDTLDADPDPA